MLSNRLEELNFPLWGHITNSQKGTQYHSQTTSLCDW